jgi:propanediol utilization protein
MRVPITIIDRHIHLSQIDADKLFWKWYNFSTKKKLLQSNEFICYETVNLKQKSWIIKDIHVILPFRKYTEVEIFKSDNIWWCIPERYPWDIEWSWEGTLIWPNWSIFLNKWVIVTKPHIHMSVAQSKDFWFKNNQIVSIKTHWKNIETIPNVKIKIKDYYEFDLHINRDIAKKLWVNKGDWWEIIK